MVIQNFTKRLIILCVLSVVVFFSTRSQSWKLTPENISRAINEASESISRDTVSPGFHLLPPAGCMGDPNGGIYYQGWYHIFYGLQPFSSDPGAWYWAHARSRDLLHWEHYQPGLTPAFELGLTNIGSGSTFITEDDQALAFYSTTEKGDSKMKFWRAVLEENLNHWQHHENTNPVLTLEHPGLPDFDKFWRDPFVFKADGRTFMIACADLFDKDYVPVPIFEAKNKNLTSWEYKKILFTYPKHEFRNFEVPELRPLGDKWIFLASADAPFDRTLYFTGNFDTEILAFIPHTHGILDYSEHYYAQETILDDQGNLFIMAWIPGWDRPFLPDFRQDELKNSSKIQNGCFALPRKLTINKQGELIRQPVESLKQLRTNHQSLKNQEIRVESAVTGIDVLEEIRGNQLELKVEMELRAASFCGLNVLCDSEGKGGLYIMWSGDVINVDGVVVPVKNWNPGQSMTLHIFVDKQIVEVFIHNGRNSVSRLLQKKYIKGDYVALTSLGGHAWLKSLDAWKLNDIAILHME